MALLTGLATTNHVHREPGQRRSIPDCEAIKDPLPSIAVEQFASQVRGRSDHRGEAEISSISASE
jgi:hypothetical protein